MAHVGQVPIYATQVQAEAKRTAKPPREALDDLIAFHLLAERARWAGRHPATSSDEEVRSVLVQRLLEQELEPRLRPEAVPDSALLPLYERAKDSFVHPRLIEIGVLAVYTGAAMKDAPRQERALAARELAAYLKNHPAKSLEQFSAVAKDPAWSARKVVYGRFLQGLDKPLSQVVGEEVAKQHTPGETTGLLSDEDGFYIARYIGDQPPANVSFAEARPKLLAAYLDRYQRKEFVEFADRLVRSHKAVVNYDRLPQNEQGP